MKTLQVPQTTYVTYDLTDAEEYVLSVFLDLDVSHAVISRQGNQNGSFTEPQKVLAIKWWRARFACGLKEAKDAVEAYAKQAAERELHLPRKTQITIKHADSGYMAIGFVDGIYDTRIHDNQGDAVMNRRAVYVKR